MTPQRARFLSASAALTATIALLSGCGSSGGTPGSSGTASAKPILIGASLSLTGDFSADGQAFKRGYELWAADVNASGGLLHRQVKLDILNDNSSPTQVDTNYTDLITVKHVDLTFGPFSSLLTAPSAEVAHRYGFAFIEGAGGAPIVFGEKLPNVFDVSLPVANELDPFVNWIKSLPAGQRPASAAYPAADDPFTTPQVQRTQGQLQAIGIKTAYSKVFPEEVPDYQPNAALVAGSGAQAVVLGSIDLPTVSAFVHTFAQQHYNPKIFIATAGPDQGQAFLSTVGKANATGIMVPNSWYPGYDNAQSQAMVRAYIAKYGGNASDINADVAEAYSVGQVTAQAVKATGGTTGSKITAFLHSGVTLSSVQGPVTFNGLGQNLKAAAFIFQWQNGKYVQVLPLGAAGSVKIINPKPAWAG